LDESKKNDYLKRLLKAKTLEEKNTIKDEFMDDVLVEAVDKSTPVNPPEAPQPESENPEPVVSSTETPPVEEQDQITIDGKPTQEPKSFFRTKKFVALGASLAFLVGLWAYFSIVVH
jgi:hypothetical protein